MSANGEPKVLPTLSLGWDAATQNVHLAFDPKDFRTWDFILAVLEMAKLEAQQQRSQCIMASMQKKAVEARHNQEILGRILKG